MSSIDSKPLEVTVNIISAPTAVSESLRAVTVAKGNRFKACFPRTVELPQLKAANVASKAAMIVLSSQSAIDVVPNVTRYPPNMAINAKPINLCESFSFRIIEANEIANNG